MRELRAAPLGMIDKETRELQAAAWDEDVEAADFWMMAAVARHLGGLLGGGDATVEAEIGVSEAAMEEEIVMKAVERNASTACGRSRATCRGPSAEPRRRSAPGCRTRT